jgi:CRP/FNR family transcriptional regulator, transcriptional activator FtrB
METDLASRASGEYHPDTSARDALRSVAWLREVPRETIDALAAEAVLHRMPAGSLVFEQAETPVFAQFLLAGSIELLGVRDQVETLVELLQPVDLVIPAAVVGGQPYLMRARVYEEAHLLLIRAEVFRQAVASDNALCRAVLGCLAAQFRRQVRVAKNLKLRSAEERVGCYLVALLQRDNRAATIRLPIEKHLIASQLGMTRETFSRALSGMAKFGIRVIGDVLHVEDASTARARFALDPLIDGAEPIVPLRQRKI